MTDHCPMHGERETFTAPHVGYTKEPGCTCTMLPAASMTDATELDEAAIRARLEAATPEPWEHVRVPFRDTASHSVKRGHQVLALVGWEREEAERAPADAEFIAHARTDVRLLLTALDEARAEIEGHDRHRELWAQWLSDIATRAEAAESALAAVRALVRRWRLGRLAVAPRHLDELDAALATPTTTEEPS